MTLKYGLADNGLTPDQEDQRAVMYVDEVKILDELVDEMIGRGSTVTKAEALSVMEEYYDAMTKFLGEGYTITTPAYSITPRIRGVFKDKKERYDPNKHRLYLSVKPRARLKEALRHIKLEYRKSNGQQPLLEELTDLMSESTNEQLTPGGIAHLNGELLKFEGADPQQGIFFRSGNRETRVVPKTVARNMPAELIFMVPATLNKGPYQVEVRTVLHGSKKLRIAKLPDEVVV